MQNKSKKHRKHIFKIIQAECSVNKAKLREASTGDFLMYHPKHRSYLKEKIYWFEVRKSEKKPGQYVEVIVEAKFGHTPDSIREGFKNQFKYDVGYKPDPENKGARPMFNVYCSWIPGEKESKIEFREPKYKVKSNGHLASILYGEEKTHG